MASLAQQRAVASGYAASGFERVLGGVALALLVMIFVALTRGSALWPEIPALVWLHIATIIVALAITPVMMWRRRGDRWHRRLGYVWCAAMLTTAIISFWIHETNGGLSFIHIFSVITLVGVPGVVIAARKHDLKSHRSAVRGLVIGALLVAGVFTFPGARIMGRMLFG